MSLPDRLRSIQRLSRRRQRDRTQQFLVEGPQAVRELLLWHPESVVEVLLAREHNTPAAQVAEAADQAGARVTLVEASVLRALAETEHPQGVLAVAAYLPDSGPVPPRKRSGIAVVLHQVRDPGNAGTVLRTADAVDADLVVFGDETVDPYNNKVVRSCAGSLFHVPVARRLSTASALSGLAGAGYRIVTTRLDATAELGDPDSASWLRQPTAWVFGNEAHGLPDETSSQHAVRLPIYGSAESLNLAVAAAVCLYASAWARRGVCVGDSLN